MTKNVDATPLAPLAPLLSTRSRRRVVAFGIWAGVAGIAAGLPASRGMAQGEPATDIDLLNFLLSIEDLEVALIEDGLSFLDDDNLAAAGLGQEARLDLEEIRDQDQAHAAALADAIAAAGGTAGAPATYTFGYSDALSFLRIAAGVAETVVAAYAGVIPQLADSDVAVTVLGIHSVEGRHAAFLRLNSALSPFPAPIDQPLSQDDVVANLAGYTGNEPGPAAAPTASAAAPVAPNQQPADARNVFAAVLADAADRLQIDESQIDIVDVIERDWPTSALGCPAPDAAYAQVVTPGYLVLLNAAGTSLEYHTDLGAVFVLCE